MSRSLLSRPLQQALSDGLLSDTDVFDYGCGRGDDVRTLSALGLEAHGWDPAHSPGSPRRAAGLVNLGYVVNVIEDPLERVDVLKSAWELAGSVLVVSARLTWEMDGSRTRPFGDGVLTSADTFQKFFTHEELKAWVESILGRPAVTAAPGVLYVFRKQSDAQQLLARITRRSSVPRRGFAELLVEQHREAMEPLREFVSSSRRLPRADELETAQDLIEVFGSLRSAFLVLRHASGAHFWADVDLGAKRRSKLRFDEHIEDLQPLMDFVAERGRTPRPGELANEATLNQKFGSVRAAFSLVRKVTGPSPWEEYELHAKTNFMIYSALAAFSGRPKFSELPDDLQHDAKDLFGSYRNACQASDQLLHQIADMDAIDQACQEAPFGKLTGEALYVHVDYLNQLPALLRVYEGAARHITGNVDDATLVKLNRIKPQVSFLVYPTFEVDPHPALEASIVAKLGEIRMKHRFFGNSSNPPILHRKEAFVPETHPTWAKFRRLTDQEERASLLDRPDIGTRHGWDALLEAAGYSLRGHRLVKAS